MLCIDECIDSLGDDTILSTLSANSLYWQVKVANEDRSKTTFASNYGLFRFIKMSFGLGTNPGRSNARWTSNYRQLNGIFAKSSEEHIAHV